MSDFAVPVVTIRAIEPIPNADAIELAVVGEYRSVVRKGQYHPGDLAVYLPEAAIIPADLLERLGLTGKLSGGAKNRVKAIKLRGCLSQGILHNEIPPGAVVDDDVAAYFDIVKYNPKNPAHMAGRATLAATPFHTNARKPTRGFLPMSALVLARQALSWHCLDIVGAA